MFKYQKAILSQYENTPYYYDELSAVYGNYSVYKSRSFEAIKSEMQEYNGYGMRITSHNCMVYTCSYKYDTMNPETGEIITHLVHHTPTKRIEFEI